MIKRICGKVNPAISRDTVILGALCRDGIGSGVTGVLTFEQQLAPKVFAWQVVLPQVEPRDNYEQTFGFVFFQEVSIRHV